MAKKQIKGEAVTLDFSNVKDGGGKWNKRRQKAGDYLATVTDYEKGEAKSDGTTMWIYTIQVGDGTYAYYCKLQENQLWKVRNLFIAAGLTVPKEKLKVVPTDVVGKQIAVTLEDDEYEGRAQSTVENIYPAAEYSGGPADDADEDEDDEPKKGKKDKKKDKKDRSSLPIADV